MVKGLDIFIEHFENFTDQYILIGGGACRDWGLSPHTAKKYFYKYLIINLLYMYFHFCTSECAF
jgi:hypothetical protein